MSQESPQTKPWYRRPWVWIVAAIAVFFLVYNFNKFPAGRYECTWSGGTGPEGELAGQLVVTVGQWPGTFPLKGRIYTSSGPVTVTDWSHVHRDFERELHAVVPIAGVNHQALCELQ